MDTVFYSGAILYDSEIQATMEFEYLQFKFKVWDYFSLPDTNPLDDVTFRASVYDPSYYMPS